MFAKTCPKFQKDLGNKPPRKKNPLIFRYEKTPRKITPRDKNPHGNKPPF